MTTDNRLVILNSYKQKLLRCILLLHSSLLKIKPYDPDKEYTADELEPYDALSDRFIRTVEMTFKYLRSFQLYHEAISSDTLRDLLLYAEKNDVIKSSEAWFEMREIRNRITHDYISEQIKMMFDDIMGPFATEIEYLKLRIEN
jgi:hypothetical protein